MDEPPQLDPYQESGRDSDGRSTGRMMYTRRRQQFWNEDLLESPREDMVNPLRSVIILYSYFEGHCTFLFSFTAIVLQVISSVVCIINFSI